MKIKTAISHTVHLRPTTFFRHWHCPDTSLHATPSAPPKSHWQPIRESKNIIWKTSEKQIVLCPLWLKAWNVLQFALLQLKCQPRKFSSKGFLTVTTKILLFLQQEISILTGVTWMSTCIWLTVTLSTFLDKYTIVWLSHTVKTLHNCLI